MASSSSSQSSPPLAEPYAVALIYKPTVEAAIEAGVRLPHSKLTLAVPVPKAVELGVLLPVSGFHINTAAAAPPNPISSDTRHDSPPPQAPAHKQVPLPASIYPAATEIHPKYFDMANSFVRIQDYVPGSTIIPKPASGQSTSGILYAAGTISIKPGDTLAKLQSVHISTMPGLYKALSREGPLLVEVDEVQSMEEAPQVYRLIKAKTDLGWACLPEIKTLKSLSTIAVKLQEVQDTLLPMLRENPGDAKTGRKIKKRLRIIKENAGRVRNKVRADVISPMLCNTISRALQKAHGKKPKPLTYLQSRVDPFLQLVGAELRRSISFV